MKRSIQRFLERRLKLKVNENKSSVAPTDQTTFLGFTFKGGKIRWSDKAFHEFKLMERILPDIAEVLDAGDDLGESPDEFEGRIVTLAVGAEDWGVPG